jgi:ABC-2 type transport system permease protein
MKKIFLIGWKDVLLVFRDPAALILMLAAPFLLTLGLGFVTGGMSGGSSSGPSNIPVVLVNLDGGQLGNAMVDLFQSKDLNGLVAPTLMSDPAQARQLVDTDKTAAVIIVPAGFTQSIIPAVGVALPSGATVQIELYTNPSRPTSSGVIKAIVEEFVSRVEVGRVSGQVAVIQLIQSGLIGVQDAAKVGGEIGTRLSQTTQTGSTIGLKTLTASGEAVKFNILAFMAPGMALMFLMYTVSNGGRTLLAERARGTLPRLLVAPVTPAQVLAGKVFGVFLTGAAQMLILIVASTLLFQLDWGDPLAVVLLVLAAVFGAVGWGMLITSLAKTPGQVSTIGSAIMLLFGMMGGSFFSLGNMPDWFQVISKITPNAWGMDGFNTLAAGGSLVNILTPISGLLVMGIALFGVAALIFNRRGMAQG